MDTLTDLFDPAQREQHDDFVRRYENGPPWAQLNDQEAIDEYRRVTPQLSETDYRDSARDAYERLTPEERRKFGRWMRKHAREQGTPFGRDWIAMASLIAAIHATRAGHSSRASRQPLREDSLGGNERPAADQGGLGGLLNSPIARAAIGEIRAAMALSN